MVIGAKTFLLLVLSLNDAQSVTQVRDMIAQKPKASVTLEINGTDHSVRLLEQTNVSVLIKPAEAQDLRIAHAFELECQLQQDSHLLTVAAYADSKYHLVPLDILSYKTYDPSYVKLALDEIYLTNRIDPPDLAVHRVHIDFYERY